MTQNSGPDWAPILGGLAGVLAAIGTAWGVIAGAIRLRKADEDKQEENTLAGVWKLVKELQEERDKCSERIEALERRITFLETTRGVA